ARLVAVPGDVTKPDDVRMVLDTIRRVGEPLTAVVHAAGVLDDAPLVELDPERLQAVLAPKAMGIGRVLDGLRERGWLAELEAVVLVSSATAWLGAPGQGSYAVANGWLDGTAEA